jgi:hypothetical protein
VPATPAATPAPSQIKRPAPVIPSTPAPHSKKARGAAGPAALSLIAASINNFGENIRESLAPSRDGLESTPKRKMSAILRAQKLEAGWLLESQLIQFINILKSDKDAVDAYSVLQIESLRKGWVREQLGIPEELDFSWLNS